MSKNDIKSVKELVAALKTVSEVMKGQHMLPAEKKEEGKSTGVIVLPSVKIIDVERE